MGIHNTEYVGDHTFKCGQVVPVYDVLNHHGFNQILGHVKFNNREYGNVYYRGENKLHDTLKPSLMRMGDNPHKLSRLLTSVVDKVLNDAQLKDTLKLHTNNAKHIVEGMLQHYGIPTRNIDLVDNHWVALWMGLNKCVKTKSLQVYYHYEKREIPYPKLADHAGILPEEMYQYILLVALPYAASTLHDGVAHSEHFVEIDLRQALPSFFIRPHAQHGIVAKKKIAECLTTDDYDMATQVCAIFRIRIDRAALWLGAGNMLTQDNLFPPAAYDGGYNRLLLREDIFKTPQFEIARYF